jgi:hypothetical protein
MLRSWFRRRRDAAVIRARKTRAQAGGFFWLPCDLCGEYFGGDEWDADDAFCTGVAPKAMGGGMRYTGVCAKCGPRARSMSETEGRALMAALKRKGE